MTDDRHPADLKEHINGMVRRAVEAGVDPVKAVQIASLNTAEYFGLNNLGAVAPGYKADLLILPDLKSFKPDLVIKNGVIAAENGRLIAELPENEALAVRNSVNVRWITPEDFRIEAKGSKVTALEVIPHQLITKYV